MRKIFCILLLLLNFISCKEKAFSKVYGKNAYYFNALCQIQNNNESKAIKLLKKACKKSNRFLAEKSYQKLVEIGNQQTKIESALEYKKRFPGKKSLLVLLKLLHSYRDFDEIIAQSNDVGDLEDDELTFYRIDALRSVKDSRFMGEFHKWIVERNFSSHHLKISSIDLKSMDCPDRNVFEFRKNVYCKNYNAAFKMVKEIIADEKNLTPSVLRDVGKSLLYGSRDYEENALYLESVSGECDGDLRFYAEFYEARLYGKKASLKDKAILHYHQCMKCAKNLSLDSDGKFDNALWYYLEFILNNSLAEISCELEKYCGEFKNPSYYDDFFEHLSLRLFENKEWELLYRIAKIIDGKASVSSVSKFSYLAARLIQEKNLDVPANEIKPLFEKSLIPGSDLYYKFLACEKLGLEDEKMHDVFKNLFEQKKINADDEKEMYVLGLVDHKLKENLYEEYLLYDGEVSDSCAEKVSRYLSECGKMENKYAVQSLRVAARRVFDTNNVSIQTLAYPENFKVFVEYNCKKFAIEPYVMYSLIRTESFFNPSVKSHAGAKGLTQLMDLTAGDVAKKLGVKEYDLLDPSTNIAFGTFYFEELQRRLDGSPILASFSYNGGISRVRTWLKNSPSHFGMKNVPVDLFLETVPISETREYGKKLLSASCMYAYLYDNISPCRVVEEVMR